MDSEESCVYCSKYLFGLNDFNRKMHIETCKVRKLVESQANFNNNNNNNNGNATGGANSTNSSSQNQSNGNANANGGGAATTTAANAAATTASSLELNLNNPLEDYMILGENCSYCFKSFKDYKNDFNKRLHIKCCKIKKVCCAFFFKLSF